MKKFVHAICYFINMYIFFIVICGFMTAIPNLNMNFIPLRMMFTLAGFNFVTKPQIIGLFIPLLFILILIALRKVLYKLIGENDKFFDYDVVSEKDKKNTEENEDINNGNEDTDRSDNDN